MAAPQGQQYVNGSIGIGIDASTAALGGTLTQTGELRSTSSHPLHGRPFIMRFLDTKYLIIAAMLLPIVLLALALVSPDGPDYEVLERGDGFELRDYAPLRVAETKVAGSFADADETAYPLLLDYIRGRNATGRKVPMLAPVMQQQTQLDGGDAGWLMQFVMAKEYPMSMLPPPAVANVALRQLPRRLVAARRYRGSWDEAHWQEQAVKLLDAVQEAGLLPLGEPVFARYNAPFVPGLLRRNEVLLTVER